LLGSALRVPPEWGLAVGDTDRVGVEVDAPAVDV
jgi:hypothetical protein